MATICLALILGLLVAMGGCGRKEESHEAEDLESVRAGLREQVARGELTREEAVVRLAEATRDAKLGSGGKGKGKLPAALEAYGKELKERVAKGEMTEEEAMTAWMKATEKAKSSAKAADDSLKEKK